MRLVVMVVFFRLVVGREHAIVDDEDEMRLLQVQTMLASQIEAGRKSNEGPTPMAGPTSMRGQLAMGVGGGMMANAAGAALSYGAVKATDWLESQGLPGKEMCEALSIVGMCSQAEDPSNQDIVNSIENVRGEMHGRFDQVEKQMELLHGKTQTAIADMGAEIIAGQQELSSQMRRNRQAIQNQLTSMDSGFRKFMTDRTNEVKSHMTQMENRLEESLDDIKRMVNLGFRNQQGSKCSSLGVDATKLHRNIRQWQDPSMYEDWERMKSKSRSFKFFLKDHASHKEEHQMHKFRDCIVPEAVLSQNFFTTTAAWLASDASISATDAFWHMVYVGTYVQDILDESLAGYYVSMIHEEKDQRDIIQNMARQVAKNSKVFDVMWNEIHSSLFGPFAGQNKCPQCTVKGFYERAGFRHYSPRRLCEGSENKCKELAEAYYQVAQTNKYFTIANRFGAKKDAFDGFCGFSNYRCKSSGGFSRPQCRPPWRDSGRIVGTRVNYEGHCQVGTGSPSGGMLLETNVTNLDMIEEDLEEGLY